MEEVPYRTYVNEISAALETTLRLAEEARDDVQRREGDSDLYRKLAFYLVPSLHHWINGMQAGNMKDLRELLVRREKELANPPQKGGKQGNGHEVLTEPKK